MTSDLPASDPVLPSIERQASRVRVIAYRGGTTEAREGTAADATNVVPRRRGALPARRRTKGGR